MNMSIRERKREIGDKLVDVNELVWSFRREQSSLDRILVENLVINLAGWYMYCFSLFRCASYATKATHKAKQNVLNMRDPRMGQRDEIEV